MISISKRGYPVAKAKGFHLTCANGITVSVQFGYGNYCGNRDVRDDDRPEHSYDAEVAVWDRDGKWLIPDDVAGYVSADEVAEVIGYAQALTAGEPWVYVFRSDRGGQ